MSDAVLAGLHVTAAAVTHDPSAVAERRPAICTRHSELNGADSGRLPTYVPEPSFQLREFRVQLKDDGPAWWVTLRASGPRDAANQARFDATVSGATGDVGVLRVVETGR